MSWVDIVNQGHPCKKVSRNKTQLKGTKTTPKPAKFWIQHLFVHIFTPENERKWTWKWSQGTGDHPHLGILSFFRDSKFNTLRFFIGKSSRSPMRSFRNVGDTATLLVKRSSAAGSKRKTFMCSAWLLAIFSPENSHGISTWDTPEAFRKISVTTTFRYIFSRDPMYAPYKNL